MISTLSTKWALTDPQKTQLRTEWPEGGRGAERGGGGGGGCLLNNTQAGF